MRPVEPPPTAASAARARALDQARTRRIIRTIRDEEARLRARHPWLAHQDALGAAIFGAGALGMVLMGALYVAAAVPAWSVVIVNAVLASLLHELEHDLIHGLYFKRRPGVEKAMMLGVWVLRGNTLNPFYRRALHRLHHRVSGTPEDVEERLITNGMRWSPWRLVAAFDGFISLLLQSRRLRREAAAFDLQRVLRSSFPVMSTWLTLWYTLIGAHLALWLLPLLWPAASLPGFVGPVMDVLNTAAVVWLLPNFIRQGCLQLVSSNMHYYGDVDSMIRQTQVLNHWALWPLHLFCFNFGATHGIHHFVVNQPFYLRQMVAGAAHRAMRRYGVRFNDFGNVLRANRYAAAVGPQRAGLATAG